jgi:hypothetical protein
LSISRFRLAKVFWFFAMVTLLYLFLLHDPTGPVAHRQLANSFA